MPNGGRKHKNWTVVIGLQDVMQVSIMKKKRQRDRNPKGAEESVSIKIISGQKKVLVRISLISKQRARSTLYLKKESVIV